MRFQGATFAIDDEIFTPIPAIRRSSNVQLPLLHESVEYVTLLRRFLQWVACPIGRLPLREFAYCKVQLFRVVERSLV